MDKPLIGKATLRDVRHERQRQDAQWGGQDHDDEHEPDDWLGFVAEQATKGEQEWDRRSKNPESNDVREAGEFEVRDRLVKIAALALAGIDSIDRKVIDRG